MTDKPEIKKFVAGYLISKRDQYFQGKNNKMSTFLEMSEAQVGRIIRGVDNLGELTIVRIGIKFDDLQFLEKCAVNEDLLRMLKRDRDLIETPRPAKITIIGVVDSDGNVQNTPNPEIHYTNIPLQSPQNPSALLIQGFLDFSSGFYFIPNDLAFLSPEKASTGNIVLVSKGRSRFVRRFWGDSFTDPDGKPDNIPYKVISKLISLHRRLD